MSDAEVRCIRCEIKTIIGTGQVGHVNILIGICDRTERRLGLMSKWTNGSRWNSDVNNISGFLFSCASNMCADKAIAAHNADIDALTAERDELRRRLDAVVAIVGLEQQGEFEDWPAGEHIRALRDVRAIAEGREG